MLKRDEKRNLTQNEIEPIGRIYRLLPRDICIVASTGLKLDKKLFLLFRFFIPSCRFAFWTN